MAKLQKFTSLLATGTVLGIFVFSGPVSAAIATPSGIVIKTADPVGKVESGESDSDEDDADEDANETQRLKKPHPKVEGEESSVSERIEKKRRELREKFGTKDSLGLPPIVIHPEDHDDDDSDEDDAAVVKPKKKPVTSVSPSSASSATATVDPSIFANSSSLKGGQLATSPSAVKPSTTTNQGVAPQVSQSVVGSTSSQKTQSNSTLPEQQSAPIDIKKADVTGKSPTDKFVEASTSAIGAMAVGAVALGAVTIIRGKRQQKEQKAEYLYGSDT